MNELGADGTRILSGVSRDRQEAVQRICMAQAKELSLRADDVQVAMKCEGSIHISEFGQLRN